MIKALKKLEIEGMFLNIMKAIYDKTIASIILNGEQLIPFQLNQEQDRNAHFLHSLQYSFEIPGQTNKTKARNKRDSNRERRSQAIPICI
jgi:hypothetical protein